MKLLCTPIGSMTEDGGPLRGQELIPLRNIWQNFMKLCILIYCLCMLNLWLIGRTTKGFIRARLSRPATKYQDGKHDRVWRLEGFASLLTVFSKIVHSLMFVYTIPLE